MTMIHGRTLEEVKKYNLFKWSILGGLGLLLIFLIWSRPKPVVPGINQPAKELSAGETVDLTGTGKAGDSIELIIGGKSAGIAVVDKNGQWSLPISIVNSGSYDIVAHLVDGDGKTIVISEPLTVSVVANVVDTGEKPVIAATVPDLASWDWNDGKPSFAGEGVAEEIVELVDGKGNLIGTAVVGEDGKWAIGWDQLTLAGPGSYDLAIKHKNGAGEVVATETVPSWVISEEAWVASGGSIAIVEPVVSFTVPDLANWDWSNGRLPSFAGEGVEGQLVELVDGNGNLIGTAVVGEDGKWAIGWDQLTLAGAGSYDLAIKRKNGAGEVVATEIVTGWVISEEVWAASGGSVAIVEPVEPVPPVVSAPDLANWDWSNGKPGFAGEGAEGQLVELVDGNGHLIGTAVVGEDGKWAIGWDQLTLAGAGSYDLIVSWKNEAGEVVKSGTIANWAVSEEAWVAAGGTIAIVEPVEPVPPVVSAPDLANWDWSNGKPGFAGEGVSGEIVELVDGDGHLIGTAVVGEDGKWAIGWDQLTLAGAGSYDLSVTRKNEAGEVVSTEDIAAWVISEEVWAASGVTIASDVIIDIPITNEVKGNSIQLSGWARPSSHVEFLANGVAVGSVLVGKDGRWIFDYVPASPTGLHEITAYLAGDEQARSAVLQLQFAQGSIVVGDGSESRPSTPIGSVVGCTGNEIGEDRGTTYVVAPCEWMMQIARHLNISYWSLRLANPQVYNPNWIYPGQILNLPSDRYEQTVPTP